MLICSHWYWPVMRQRRHNWAKIGTKEGGTKERPSEEYLQGPSSSNWTPPSNIYSEWIDSLMQLHVMGRDLQCVSLWGNTSSSNHNNAISWAHLSPGWGICGGLGNGTLLSSCDPVAGRDSNFLTLSFTYPSRLSTMMSSSCCLSPCSEHCTCPIPLP